MATRIVAWMLLLMAPVLAPIGAAVPRDAGRQAAQAAEPANPSAQAVQEFRTRVDAYVEIRKKAEAAAPKLPQEATPQEIDLHQRTVEKVVREARVNAKQGDVFTPAMQKLVYQIMKELLGRQEGRQLKSSIMDENPVALKVGVNDRYPDAVPLTTMPPQLLKELPELPEELEYRFVSDNLILLDPRAHVIVDYVPAALSE